MYKRNEDIEEEHLDWEDQDKQPPAIPKVVNVPKPLLAPKIKDQSSQMEEYKGLNHTLDMKRKMMHIFNENIKLLSLIGLLIIPYVVGFVLTYLLFYFYGGMTVGGFVDIKKEYLPLQLWSIGTYLFVTLWVIWAIVNMFKKGE